MDSDIKVNGHYKATVVGYEDNNNIFVELDNKFTAYLDISEYYLVEEDVYKNFKVNQVYNVVVTCIDKDGSITCKLEHPINTERSNTIQRPKSKKQKKKESEVLTYNLGSIMPDVELDDK